METVKVKQSHYRPDRPWGFQEVEAVKFEDIQHMKVVRLSALSTDCLYPQKVFLVLISVRGWVNPMVIVHLEGLCQWKIPMKPSGIEPATFRLLAQCLNELHPWVLLYGSSTFTKNTRKYSMTPHGATHTTWECETLCSWVSVLSYVCDLCQLFCYFLFKTYDCMKIE